jgi:hypothetical protein
VILGGERGCVKALRKDRELKDERGKEERGEKKDERKKRGLIIDNW